MSALGGWAFEALVASALLMAAVLLVRVPVRRAFGPGVAYALWALPPLRLALPPLPAWWHAATPIARASDTITYLIVDSGTASPVVGAAASGLGPMLAVLWLAGAALFLGWHAVNHLVFCRRMLAEAVPIGRQGSIAVIASAAAAGPLAFGILRRFVAFPADIAERYDADERDLALAHELGHHRSGDLIANWAGLVLLALHWFNPVAWRAYRAFRADQELANDARVLAGRDPLDRHTYACAILKAAHGGTLSAACHLHTVKDLKGRLKMLTTSRTSRRRLATGSVSIALLTIAGLGLTASGTSAAAVINNGVGAATGVDLQIPEPPAPTTPPAPAVPPAPIATDVPPMPPTPPSGKQSKRVVIVKDGKATTYDGAEADAYIAAHPMPSTAGKMPNLVMAVRAPDGTLRPMTKGDMPSFTFDGANPSVLRDKDGKVIAMPEVVRLTCPPSAENRNIVTRENKDGKERIIICANRMHAMTDDAQKLALNSDAMAVHAQERARASLRVARAAIETENGLSADQRRDALAGIAQAEAELAATDK